MTEERRNRRQVTLMYDTGAREDDALFSFRWVLPAVLLLTSFIFLFTLTGWYVPHFPVLIFGAVVLVPLSLAIVWRADRREVGPLLVAIAMVGSFGLPLLAWNIGPYRAAALFVIGDYLPEQSLMAAMTDRNDRVSAMACSRLMLSDQVSQWENRVRGVLQSRPETARRCLQSIDAEHQRRAEAMARYLNREWFSEWMEGGVLPEARACAAAQVFAETSTYEGGEGINELLLCALGSPNRAYQQCCGEALSQRASGQEDRRSLNPARMTRDRREQLFTELIRAVDVPAAVLLNPGPFREDLQWSAGDLFHWATGLGCYLLDDSSRPESIARQLSLSLEEQCGLEIDDPLTSSAGIAFVRATCAEALESQDGRVDIVEWCDAARGATAEATMNAARFVIAQAVAAYGIDAMERGIGQGSTVVRRQAREEVEDRQQVEETIRRGTQGEFQLEMHEGAEGLRNLTW